MTGVIEKTNNKEYVMKFFPQVYCGLKTFL